MKGSRMSKLRNENRGLRLHFKTFLVSTIARKDTASPDNNSKVIVLLEVIIDI